MRGRSIMVVAACALVLAAGLVTMVRATTWSTLRSGGLIVFVSGRAGNGEIYVVRPDGGGVRRLTRDPSGEIQPTWSADDRKIAFTSASTDSGPSRVVVMNADGSGRRRLSSGFSPVWSPDGKRLAFLRLHHPGSSVAVIYVMNADGSGLRRLTNVLVSGVPSWSPDGRRLVFDRATTDARRLTENASEPSWQPRSPAAQ